MSNRVLSIPVLKKMKYRRRFKNLSLIDAAALSRFSYHQIIKACKCGHLKSKFEAGYYKGAFRIERNDLAEWIEEKKKWVRRSEAARIVGVTLKAIRDWMKRGLPYQRQGNIYLIDRDALVLWVKNNRAKPKTLWGPKTNHDPSRKGWIYFLLHPVTKAVIYVGQTTKHG